MKKIKRLFKKTWNFLVRHMESALALSVVAFVIVVLGAGLILARGHKRTASAAEGSFAVALEGMVAKPDGFAQGSKVIVQSSNGSVGSSFIEQSGRFVIPELLVNQNNPTGLILTYNIPGCQPMQYRSVLSPIQSQVTTVRRDFAITCVSTAK